MKHTRDFWDRVIVNTIMGIAIICSCAVIFLGAHKNSAQGSASTEKNFTWYVQDAGTQELWELDDEPDLQTHYVSFTVPETGDQIWLYGDFRIRKMVNR